VGMFLSMTTAILDLVSVDYLTITSVDWLSTSHNDTWHTVPPDFWPNFQRSTYRSVLEKLAIKLWRLLATTLAPVPRHAIGQRPISQKISRRLIHWGLKARARGVSPPSHEKFWD
jgi:hypothetical protein